MRTFTVFFIPLFSVVFLMGCGQLDFSLDTSSSHRLFGSIKNIGSSGLSKGTAYSSCAVGGQTVELYSLDSTGQKDKLLKEASVDEDGKFTFTNVNDVGLNFDNGLTTTNFALFYTCDDETYQRFVTGPEEQVISDSTTLFSWLAESGVQDKVSSQSPSTWTEFYDSLLGASSQTEAFSILRSDPQLKLKFQDIFGVDPNVFLEVPPKIKVVRVPQSFDEMNAKEIHVEAYHWSADYSMAYAWKLGSQTLSQASSFSYTPSANSQGHYNLRLFVGKDAGDGTLDTSAPYTQETFSFQIQNSLPAQPPELNLLSSEYTASTTVSLQIETGSLVDGRPQFCKSFSKMALVEEAFPGTALPPTLPSSYTLDCDTANFQNVSFNLDGTEGQRVLRLWAIDSSNNVSLTSTNVTLIYDSTAPVLSLTSLNSGESLRGGDAVNITWSATDDHLEANPVSIDYTTNNGLGWTSLVTGAGNSGTYEWTVPGIDSDEMRVRISVTDLAGNVSTAVSSAAFIVDSTPPSAPTVSLDSAALTNDRNVSVSVVCDADYDKILLSEDNTTPSSNATGWQTCEATKIFQVSSGDGSKTIYVWSKDKVGNVALSSNSVSLTLDQTPPVLGFLSPDAGVASAASLTVAGNCETGLQVSLSGDEITDTTAACNLGEFSALVPLEGSDGDKDVQISQVDAAGNSSSASRIFTKDSTPPQVDSLTINNGEATTGNRNVVLDFEGSSGREDIASFCLKLSDSAEPSDDDLCWREFTSIGETVASSQSIDDFPFEIGALLADYEVRLWLRDVAGNNSLHTETSGKDLASIFYSPDPPAVVSSLKATSTDTPSSPLSQADTTILYGADIYVKWNVTDNNAIPDGKISLSYTSDESSFTELTSGLNNGINGACTLDAESTGCAVIPASSPLNSYYKIRIEIEDSGGGSSLSTSNPINTGSFNLLSGNTSLGIGGSASNAVLIGRGEENYDSNPDPYSFVVTKKGYIFFNYNSKGLTMISPESGQISLLVPQTGARSGDGGDPSNATLISLRAITLDHEENLLLWDDQFIRKIDLKSHPWKITTLAGGGSDLGSPADALSAKLPYLKTGQGADLFAALPNGRIYFQKDKEIWYYDPLDLKVKRALTLTGYGIDDMSGSLATYDITNCGKIRNIAFAFDKATSNLTKIMMQGAHAPEAACGSHPVRDTWGVNASFDVVSGESQAPHPPQTTWSATKFTGKDGHIYVLDNGRRRLLRYDPSTNTFVKIIASPGDTTGRCADGSDALDCPAIVMDAYINEFGKVYFLDMGVIRTIDDFGKVQTLAGQPRNYGVGEDPISARYSQVNYFTVSGNDVYVKNKLEAQIVKFNLGGGTLSHIAGNSIAAVPSDNSVAVDSPLPNCGWGMPCSFMVDVSLNRLYHHASEFAYIDLATGVWSRSGPEIQDSGTRLSYLSIAPDGTLLTYAPSHYGHLSANKSTVREVSSAGTDSIVYGKDEILQSLDSHLCDSLEGTDCTYGHAMRADQVQTQFKYDAATDNWIIAYQGRSYLNVLPKGGGVTTRLTATSNSVRAFDIRRDGADLWVYYCATNGKLYARNTTTNSESELSLPSATFKCDGQAMHYHSGRNSVLFIFRQNGLSGIAEYKL